MTFSFRLAFSIAVALLFVLFVFFGSRTIDAEPQRVDYPVAPGVLPPGYSIYCNSSDTCYLETYDQSTESVDSELITPEVEANLSPAEQMALDDARAFERFDDELADHLRLMTGIAAVLGIAAIAAAVYLYRRANELSPGLLLGGTGSLIYGWVEYTRVPGEANTTVVFMIVTIGLVLVLGGGYYFLGDRLPDVSGGKKSES